MVTLPGTSPIAGSWKHTGSSNHYLKPKGWLCWANVFAMFFDVGFNQKCYLMRCQHCSYHDFHPRTQKIEKNFNSHQFWQGFTSPKVNFTGIMVGFFGYVSGTYLVRTRKIHPYKGRILPVKGRKNPYKNTYFFRTRENTPKVKFWMILGLFWWILMILGWILYVDMFFTWMYQNHKA